MTEAEAIRLAQQGDRAGFEPLVERYQRFVWSVAKRMVFDPDEADDLAQEVFVTAWRKIALYEGAARFSTWLYRITVNTTLNHIKKMGRERNKRNDYKDDPVEERGQVSDPARHQEQKSAKEELDALLATLHPDRRMAVTLREIEGLDYAEIAVVTGVPVGTVRSRIARGRDELKNAAQARREMA